MSKRVRFYTDEHVPNSVVKGLRLRGVDVITTKEAGILGATDEEMLLLQKRKKSHIYIRRNLFTFTL